MRSLCGRFAFRALRHFGRTQIRIVNGRTVVQCGRRIHGVRARHRGVFHFDVVVRLDEVVVVVVVIVEFCGWSWGRG